MAVINPYNGLFGALLVGIEATEQSAASLTKADAIPVFQQTLNMDLAFAMEQPMLEDPYGTGYLGQMTGAKCTWSFEAPVYGVGATIVGGGPNYNIGTPRYITDVLATAFDVSVSSSNSTPTPAITLQPTINHDGTNCSFTMKGIFAIKGSPGGGGSMLSAELIGCKISKATFSVKSEGLHRVKLEGIGVYNGNWSDTALDLSGHNWDVIAQEFIRGMGQNFSLQANGAGTVYSANLTTADVSIDFGAEHIISDGALSTLGVAGVGLTKRDVNISIDPVWLAASSYSIFAIAKAGGYFTISTDFAYPAAYSSGIGAKGHGVKFDLPKVQFANTTPDRTSSVRAKLEGPSVKNEEDDAPVTITIGNA
jgi:hypothetical protein